METIILIGKLWLAAACVSMLFFMAAMRRAPIQPNDKKDDGAN